MTENAVDEYIDYREDKRIPCRYGTKCYQKNAIHHEKYKHPPTKKTGKIVMRTTIGKRKKKDENQPNDLPQKKMQKTDHISNDEDLNNDSPLKKSNTVENKDDCRNNSKESTSPDLKEHKTNFNNQITIGSLLETAKIINENYEMNLENAHAVIYHLFFTTMPEDFYQLYEFCKSISEKDPFNALKDVQLQLVGPYDVLRNNFLTYKVDNKEALLRHWRYYYDPPEFQTIVRDVGEDGLHYGYWRDDILENPVFVAKNRAALNCLIEPVAENLFGALDVHIAERLMQASPFVKIKVAKLHQRLKNFAKENKITLEKKTNKMQAREKQVVTRTFHKAGIVVPYNKKTELGYRDLAVTDNELHKILKQIENAPDAGARKTPLCKLEEVIRLATIAADECDFGTVLELGHDLFSSGVSYVQTKALNLLSLGYTLLQRSGFLEIAQAHLKDRKKSFNLSVLQN